MSVASIATEFILSDSLIREPKDSKAKGLRLELATDRMIKFISVGLPLLLVSAALAKEISLRSQITCFPPSNFSLKQAAYVDLYCWETLLHHQLHPNNNMQTSLWIHKVFPYSLLAIGMTMYLPSLIWKAFVTPVLTADLLFIIDELDKAYNRSIKVVQLILKKYENNPNAKSLIQEELDRARREKLLEFPLLQRYLACKKRSYYYICMYYMRQLLLLVFIAAACLYLIYCHLPAFFLDQFSCSIKSGLLTSDSNIPAVIQCKLTSLTIFKMISVVNGSVYLLLVPMIIHNLLKLCYWDKQFLAVYQMLPAFDLVSKKMLGCALNDLNMILHFLRTNINQLQSFSRLSVLCIAKDVSAGRKGHTLVDMMALLVGLGTYEGGSCTNAGGGNGPPGLQQRKYLGPQGHLQTREATDWSCSGPQSSSSC
ncbi:pannexin-3 [Pristis pectinata]|uniref:pannexin-3 n=1 Tax=Pristis pectinata TaxID=685728 RepID=UPI00223E1ED1|nr:pannexin-3 [Pristis pectinata]